MAEAMKNMKKANLLVPVLTLPYLAMGVACTEQLPKQIGATANTTTPTATATTTSTVPTTTPIRTVSNRSPFGELRTDNLFLDGDFEFTGRSGQMPWLVFKSNGQGTIGFDTGGRCFSGMRCALMKKDDEMVGFVASAPENATRTITFSIVAKTSTGACKDVTLSVLDLNSGQGGGTIKPPAEVSADGWCHFDGTAKGIPQGELVLYVTAEAGQVWLDHAVATSTAVKPLLPIPGSAGDARGASAELQPLTREIQARVRGLGAQIRGSRIYGDRASLVREGKIVDDKAPPRFPN